MMLRLQVSGGNSSTSEEAKDLVARSDDKAKGDGDLEQVDAQQHEEDG